MNNENAKFQSIVERLATLRGLSAKPLDQLVDVPVDYTAVATFVEQQYIFLNTVYEEEVGVADIISQADFVAVIMACLAKRVQWVRSQVYGIREGRSIPIGNSVPLPGPIFQLVYSFGRVKSNEVNATFVPSLEGLENVSVTTNQFKAYMMLQAKLKHYYPFSEGLPSGIDGTWAYLLHVTNTPVGASIVGPSREGKPGDAYLAAIVRHARLMVGFFYGASYGVVANPDTTLVQFFSAYGKGIGDGQ